VNYRFDGEPRTYPYISVNGQVLSPKTGDVVDLDEAPDDNWTLLKVTTDKPVETTQSAPEAPKTEEVSE
jgi:hypothetical protein